jgi:hypothetical protein
MVHRLPQERTYWTSGFAAVLIVILALMALAVSIIFSIATQW